MPASSSSKRRAKRSSSARKAGPHLPRARVRKQDRPVRAVDSKRSRKAASRRKHLAKIKVSP